MAVIKGGDDVALSALRASRARIEGAAFFNQGFTSFGEVRLNTLTVTGAFQCDRATMDGRLPRESDQPVIAKALTLGRAQIGSTLNLNKRFTAHGCVSIRNVRIESDLDCKSGKFYMGH